MGKKKRKVKEEGAGGCSRIVAADCVCLNLSPCQFSSLTQTHMKGYMRTVGPLAAGKTSRERICAYGWRLSLVKNGEACLWNAKSFVSELVPIRIKRILKTFNLTGRSATLWSYADADGMCGSNRLPTTSFLSIGRRPADCQLYIMLTGTVQHLYTMVHVTLVRNLRYIIINPITPREMETTTRPPTSRLWWSVRSV